jgi:hypothetical protein
MACKCVRCRECGGSGSVWFSFDKQYLGTHRCDDLDELETCEECGGSGISETCQECLDIYEKEQYEKEEKE